MAKIFVTGATGKLGGLVVDDLLRRTSSDNIIAGVRSASTETAEGLRAKGIELRVADYDEPGTLTTAFKGVDRLLLVSSNAIGRRLEQHKNVIHAAKQAGIGLVAYTSILHADTSPLPPAAEHLPTEAALKEAGLPFVLLRNGWYTENYGFTIKPALKNGVYPGNAGDGRSSAASRKDYAEAAAIVLSTPGHKGKTYELAGDDAFSLGELCAAVSDLAGRTIIYRNVPEQELAEALRQFGFPDAMATALAAWDAAIAKGGLEDHSHQLSQLIGRPTTPFRDTIRELLNAG